MLSHDWHYVCSVLLYPALLFAVIAGNHLRDNWYGWAAFLTAIVKLERRDRIEASELQADKALLLEGLGVILCNRDQ